MECEVKFMEEQKVFIIMDDCGTIVDIFDTYEKAKALWEELDKTTPRTSFYYEIEERPVH